MIPATKTIMKKTKAEKNIHSITGKFMMVNYEQILGDQLIG